MHLQTYKMWYTTPWESIMQIDLSYLKRAIGRIRVPYLELILNARQISLPENWRKMTPRNLQPFIDAIHTLPDATQRELGECLERLGRVGGSNKHVPIIRAAIRDWGIQPPPDWNNLTAPNMAAWAYAHLSPAQWQNLERRVEVNARPRGDWRFYNLKFNTPPPEGIVTAKKDELARAFSDSCVQYEFRGDGFESECYAIDQTEYLIVHLTDYPDQSDRWDAENRQFVIAEAPRSFTLVFAFERTCGRLGILHDASRERCKALCDTFVQVALGACGHAHPVKYDLSRLRHASRLPAAEDLGIKSARITTLELWLDGSRERRRQYTERTGDRDI